jgi:hypothetical protein
MKRLNPATGLPFKKGEVRENGDVFYQYRKIIRQGTGYYAEYWLTPEKFKRHNFTDRSGNKRTVNRLATTLLGHAKNRCFGTPSRVAAGRMPTNGKVTITLDWIVERLEKGICEATGDKLTTQTKQPNTASLDRIDPNNPDYTPENSRIVTWQFNNMKGAYSDEEFLRVAKQLKNVKKKSTPHISNSGNRKSKNSAESSTILSMRIGKNTDRADDYRGAVQGENSYRRTKEGSGDSVGHRDAEVGAPQAPTNSQDPGHAESTVSSVEEFFERVRSKSRELDLAIRTGSKIRQSGD